MNMKFYGTFLAVLMISVMWGNFTGAQANCSVDTYVLKSPVSNLENPIKNDISGLTYNPVTNTFFMVDNHLEIIYEVDVNFQFIRQVRAVGTDDLEGITYVHGNTFAVIEEKNAILNVFEMPTGSQTAIDFKIDKRVKRYVLEMDFMDRLSNQSNTGLEGVVYDPQTKAFYIAKENFPKKIFKFSIDDTDGTIEYFEWMNEQQLSFVGDIGGLAVNPITRELIILDERNKKVHAVDLNTLALKGTLELRSALKQPEGITFNQYGSLYIVGEPRQFSMWESPCQEEK